MAIYRSTSVDHTRIRTNQATLILLLLVAFIANLPWLVLLTAAAMLLGTVLGQPGFGLLYDRVLKPLQWVKPEVLADNPEPHLFAQGLGGAVLVAAATAFHLGAEFLGWGFAWLVIGLAALNLFVGFCAGCAIYYWLNRLHVPGFVKSAPEGILPGKRPRKNDHGA